MSYYIHPSSYVDSDVKIGEHTKIWHFCHIHSGASIGSKCSLGQNVNVGNNVKIGNGVKIQNNVSVYEGVELEDYVFCGPSMVFTNDLTPRAKYPKGKAAYKKTLVKYGASIGANATIVCGNTIGKWAMVASGAVVTKDVADYALVAGVPAKQVGWVCECGSVLKDNFKKASFRQAPTTESIVRDNDMFRCDDCDRKYKLENNQLVQI
ncbi:N-acetyltransferase [Francisella philomiragia]|uniref:N-acetyltransferase n=1 Tax=Francisella philomiragia TaxID=28110 RepID=UPI0019031721|nr:acyltransferase [Francisella philomiragia]MBK2026292.1 N-acetyltransferase [Francisella philomiragia]